MSATTRASSGAFSDLRLASPRLRDDADIVLAAVQRDGAAFAFASPRLRTDRATIYRAIALHAEEVVATLDAPTLQDRTLWAGAVRFNPDVLLWLPARALDEDETVLTSVRAGVKRDGLRLFSRFPWKLFVDRRDVILATVGSDGRLLANLTTAQKADPDIVDAGRRDERGVGAVVVPGLDHHGDVVAEFGAVGDVQIEDHDGVVSLHQPQHEAGLWGIGLGPVPIQVEVGRRHPPAHLFRTTLVWAVVLTETFMPVDVVNGHHHDGDGVEDPRQPLPRVGVQQILNDGDAGVLAVDLAGVDAANDQHPGTLLKRCAGGALGGRHRRQHERQQGPALGARAHELAALAHPLEGLTQHRHLAQSARGREARAFGDGADVEGGDRKEAQKGEENRRHGAVVGGSGRMRNHITRIT